MKKDDFFVKGKLQTYGDTGHDSKRSVSVEAYFARNEATPSIWVSLPDLPNGQHQGVSIPAKDLVRAIIDGFWEAVQEGGL